jgi:hypothetical protein
MAIESTDQARPADPSARLKRYLSDALTGVFGVVALIAGIASGSGLLAGIGVGALLGCVVAIADDLFRARPAGDETSALTPGRRWGLISGGLMAVGGLVGFLIKQ